MEAEAQLTFGLSDGVPMAFVCKELSVLHVQHMYNASENAAGQTETLGCELHIGIG
jgi:hypothetical protein